MEEFSKIKAMSNEQLLNEEKFSIVNYEYYKSVNNKDAAKKALSYLDIVKYELSIRLLKGCDPVFFFDSKNAECSKIGYIDKKSAMEDIKKIDHGVRNFSKSNIGRKGRRRKSTYLCRKCGKWHITTLAKSVYKIKEREAWATS